MNIAEQYNDIYVKMFDRFSEIAEIRDDLDSEENAELLSFDIDPFTSAKFKVSRYNVMVTTTHDYDIDYGQTLKFPLSFFDEELDREAVIDWIRKESYEINNKHDIETLIKVIGDLHDNKDYVITILEDERFKNCSSYNTRMEMAKDILRNKQ